MKNKSLIYLMGIIFSMTLILSSCGGGSSVPNNDYLGKLPAISDKYQLEIEKYKEESKQATDMEDAFKYERKYKLAKEESDKAIEEYASSNLIDAVIPFDGLENSKYEVLELKVKGAHRTRVDLIGKVKIKEDLKNKYGGFEKYFFAYIKAVDKDGLLIGKPTVMSSNMGNRDPYTAGLEVPVHGSIGNLRFFGDFEKIVFISKEEYDKTK
jgi:hypothetical protein